MSKDKTSPTDVTASARRFEITEENRDELYSEVLGFVKKQINACE